jgi:hypothetical protein
LKGEATPEAGSGHHKQGDLLHRPHVVGSQSHDELRCSEQTENGKQELEQPYEHGHANDGTPAGFAVVRRRWKLALLHAWALSRAEWTSIRVSARRLL